MPDGAESVWGSLAPRDYAQLPASGNIEDRRGERYSPIATAFNWWLRDPGVLKALGLLPPVAYPPSDLGGTLHRQLGYDQIVPIVNNEE